MTSFDYDRGELSPEHDETSSARTLQGRLLEGSAGKILNAMLNAEAYVDRREIKFPRIAVLGDESTGKSSVLEAICKIPFPRGAQITTRCPVQVNLRRVPGTPWSASVWIGPDRGKEERITNPEEVTATIRRFQEENIRETGRVSNLRGEARFSSEPVNVQIEAGDVVDLTLLDLPGYFSHQGRDAKQPQEDVTRIRNTLMSCMRDEHTILLVVVRANQVIGTANIFDLLKEYERPLPPDMLRSFQSRTIYCMTMCDLVSGPNRAQDPPQNIEEILSNSGTFRADAHGWYAVVNNASRDMGIDDFSAKLAYNRQMEEEFFDTTAPYNFTSLRARCGTHNLIQRLSSILSQEIAKVIPDMSKDTAKAIFDAKVDLARLGPPPEKANDVKREFNNIIDDIRKYYRDLGDGDYNGLKKIDMEPDSNLLDQCKLGYLRSKYCREFASQVEKERLKVGEKEYMKYLCKQVNEARDGRFELAIPVKQVVIEEVRRCAQAWKALAESLCERIAATATKCFHTLIDLKASKYDELSNVLKTYVTNLINEQKEKAMNRLEWHYIDEVSRPDSVNKEYEKLVQEIRTAPIGKDVRETAEAFNKNLEMYFRFAESRFADNVIRTITTHILDVPLNDELTRARTEKPLRFVLQAMEIEKGHDLTKLMKERDDLRMKREKAQRKLEQLTKLQEALQEQASAQTEDDSDNRGVIESGSASPNGFETGVNDRPEEGQGGPMFALPTFIGTPPPPPRPQGLNSRPTHSWTPPTALSQRRKDGTGALANGIPGQPTGSVAGGHHMTPSSAPNATVAPVWVGTRPHATGGAQSKQNDMQSASGFIDGEWIPGRRG